MKNKLFFVIVVAAVIGIPCFFTYHQMFNSKYYIVRDDIIRRSFIQFEADRPFWLYFYPLSLFTILFLVILSGFISASKEDEKEKIKFKRWN